MGIQNAVTSTFTGPKSSGPMMPGKGATAKDWSEYWEQVCLQKIDEQRKKSQAAELAAARDPTGTDHFTPF
jgi:hypothetical protein